MTYPACRTWFSKYRLPAGAARVCTAAELEAQYGDVVRAELGDSATPYRICGALRSKTPPLYVSEPVLKAWLREYGGQPALAQVNSAGHLEVWYGDRIRADAAARAMDADALSVWLRTQAAVSVSTRTCSTWLGRDWSSSGKLVSREAVEEALGERLRLEEYQHCFEDDAAAQALTEVLAEGQPPVRVDFHALREWYAKYHPDSGPLRYDTAEALEEALGPELRTAYPGFRRDALRSALGRRRKPVLVSSKACRTWVEQYGAAQQQAKRAVSASSRAAPAKRPRGASAAASSAAASAAAPVSAQPEPLEGAAAVEQACGAKYRAEVTDRGLGFGPREMRRKLLEWGYEATREGCQEWLKQYRLGDGAKDGGVGMFTRSRQDLLRWHHVEQLGPTALQERYRAECGVYADRSHLHTWVTAAAQALPRLENNEDIHAHPCGEYVLEQLQEGARPEAVVEGLLREYLVQTTKERVRAYRWYREQRGEYWTAERLELYHWEWLYQQVSPERRLVAYGGIDRTSLEKQLVCIRTSLCQQLSVAEELVPLHNLSIFFKRHSAHALLAQQYGTATVFTDRVSWMLVEAYRTTFAGQDLKETAVQALRVRGEGSYDKAELPLVAQTSYLCLSSSVSPFYSSVSIRVCAVLKLMARLFGA